MGAARRSPGEYDEQIAALRADIERAEAELAQTEALLTKTRLALALREALVLDTELQLAQIANHERALGLAEHASLVEVEADRRPGLESRGVTMTASSDGGPSRSMPDEIDAAPTTPRRAGSGLSRLLRRAVLLLFLALGVSALVVFAVSRSWEGKHGGRVAAGEPLTLAKLAEATRGAPGRHRAGWKLVWHDEFNQATCPDRAKWGFEHGFVRNGELQWYQRQNASCHQGVLAIEARRADKPNPNYRLGSSDWRRNRPSAGYTSASMTSKRSFTYGRVETFARIDTRQGSWPAFWTLGTAYRHRPTAWPRSGEVDIMEYYRNTVLANVCKPQPTRCGWSSARQSLASLGGQSWANRFHLWTMEWNARKIDLFLDGKLVNHFAVADAVGAGQRNPYVNKPAYLLLSQAIGGANGGDPTNTKFPIRFQVDYVRVYQRANGA
jgi:beta-glucanase (GH16 family)